MPDSTTICRFRNLLKDEFSDLLNLINKQLVQKKFINKDGMIADASIVESSCHPVKQEDANGQIKLMTDDLYGLPHLNGQGSFIL